MCNPALAVMAVMAGTEALKIHTGNQAAEAQRKALKIQAEGEKAEALAASEEALGVRMRELREQRARARVAAGESGAMGASFAASMNQSLQQQNMDAALASKNVAFQHRAIDERLMVARSQLRKVTGLQAALQIGGAGAQGYFMGGGMGAASTGATSAGAGTAV